ncbi:MAG: cell division protein FtsW [Flavobacteriales bacterium CG_4_9_14_0_2_um_filter_35_242]|nr:FtsW/RodA/SpoVE family cell cycle protein [Zetaproteobacteria bacterium]NDK18193.1 FtsW/RodA/SpoVE family cell cycle protein [Flavobacteriales bacterium]OIO09718.1 MAG: cell division protein FtsW [Flavobacteriaceae bacterium CG1_02_35_72]PIR14755.1 MAG: cell division protein FtsW [Flavobacteriales bacterium CG11_big_fil_rev_8_21_14_0_20_35_7]PIX07377.1 MAG: cell division protein FtsW [Flavobacteriales bacterium CG_4_8_14_3_um_filter_35_10]PJA05430.1 MAG: cell division protein FtsW [Flavobac
MKGLLKNIEGDRTIWALISLLAILSFLPVYSASSNLVYVVNKGTTLGYFLKHAVLLFIGFVIIYGVHKIPYKYFSAASVLLFPVIIVLLMVTLVQGQSIEGANASRWLRIPIIGVGFQTSTLAGVVLMMYVSRYLAKNKEIEISFRSSLIFLWLPVAMILALILPANLSTTALLFFMVLILVFLGGYPLKFLGIIIIISAISFAVFVLAAKAFPTMMPNRVDTWMSRIENHFDKTDKTANFQADKAKVAIATGQINGRGPGKSIQKNFLPQSSSDFIYAIIVEEYGLLGGLFVMFIFLGFLFRIIIVARKSESIFGSLLIIGVGFPIVFQAFTNMAVAVGLFPVTGQPLPILSTGGTSIWMTCLSIGIILSVSSQKELKEIKETNQSENTLDILNEKIG